MSDLVYCTRHAAIRSVAKLMQTLERAVQDCDGVSPRDRNGPSRFQQLNHILQVLLMTFLLYLLSLENLCILQNCFYNSYLQTLISVALVYVYMHV